MYFNSPRRESVARLFRERVCVVKRLGVDIHADTDLCGFAMGDATWFAADV